MRECCTPCVVQYADWVYFNLMHPVRGATVGLLPDKLLAGFQSTHPMRGATAVCRFDPCRHFNLTHPVRGATLFHAVPGVVLTFQSNAPRAGCNCCTDPYIDYAIVFQSNAPRAGCNLLRLRLVSSCHHFNLTHPVRGATARVRRQVDVS